MGFLFCSLFFVLTFASSGAHDGVGSSSSTHASLTVRGGRSQGYAGVKGKWSGEIGELEEQSSVEGTKNGCVLFGC